MAKNFLAKFRRWLERLDLSARFKTIAQIPLVSSRHDTTSTTCHASRDVTWRAVSCCVVRAAPFLF